MHNTPILVKSLPYNIFIGLVFLVSLLSVQPSTQVAASPPEQTAEPVIYQYTVKILCSPTFGDPTQGLIVAHYMTSVTVHNPIEDYFAGPMVIWVTLTQPQADGVMSAAVSIPLAPFRATDLDCDYLVRQFGSSGRLTPGGEGYLIIQSPHEMDVSAVYTSEQIQNGQSVAISLDVETFEPRVIRDLPDLFLNRVTPQVSCATPAVSCTIMVDVNFTNPSDISVYREFKLLMRFTGQPDRVIPFSGLSTGISNGWSETFSVDYDTCSTYNCTLEVFVDSGEVIIETNEQNNRFFEVITP